MPKLPPHIGDSATRRSLLPAIATLALLLVAEGFGISMLHPATPSGNIQKQVDAQVVPKLLSPQDIALYRTAFALQRAGRFEEADAAAAGAHNPLLRGVLLGERYLAQDSSPSFSEIALWLARYGDHVQAGELYRLARERAPADASFLTEPQLVVTFKNAGSASDRSVLAGKKQWVSGLLAYRNGDAKSAAAHFKTLLDENEDELSFDDRAAAAFWAYRANLAAGKDVEASGYLAQAADEAPGFYSILARQIVGERAVKPDRKSAVDGADFLRKEPVRRAIALASIGQDALAEKELEAMFIDGGSDERARLNGLARRLGLTGARMRMAVAGAYDASRSATLYPLPRWKPTLGYRVEPALLFAIMRQESGFNPNARSASGATGVMQLMPATASAMARDARLKLSGEPAMSMTLGQRYLERLMDISSINDNLVYVIAAYNAGPGSVTAWQKSLHINDDPLLFIESIPNQQARDYVVRVMGNYWVYSSMLGGYDNVTAAALAKNQWPRYERSEKQMASMLSHLAGGDE